MSFTLPKITLEGLWELKGQQEGISLNIPVEVPCNACGKAFYFEGWAVIDTEERPDLLEAIRQNCLNQLVCPHCETDHGFLEGPLLVYAPNTGLKVIFSPIHGNSEEMAAGPLLLEYLAYQLGDVWNVDWIAGGCTTVLRSMLAYVLRDTNSPDLELARNLRDRLEKEDPKLLQQLMDEANEELKAYKSQMGKIERQQRRRDPEGWAIHQVEQAIKLVDQSASQESPNASIEQAISLLTSALEIFSRKKYALQWAEIKLRLGYIYLAIRSLGSKAENIEQAILCFREAAQKAMNADEGYEILYQCYTYLTLAYDQRQFGDRQENISQVLVYSDLALEELSAEENPEMWAAVKLARGKAYRDRSVKLGGLDNLLALHFFKEALENMSDDIPIYLWADLQLEHGRTIASHLPLDENPEEMKQNCEKILDWVQQVYTRKNAPLKWAEAERELSNLYCRLASITQKKADINQSITHLNRAIEIFPKEKNPEMWARLHTDLGNIYAKHLDKAPNSYFPQLLIQMAQAIEVFQSSDNRQDLINTWRVLGALHEKKGNLEEAAKAYHAAIYSAEKQLKQSYSPISRRATIMETSDLYTGAARCLLETGQLSDAFTSLERRRNRLLLEYIHLTDVLPDALPRRVRRKVLRLRKHILKLEAHFYGGITDIGEVEKLIELRRELQDCLGSWQPVPQKQHLAVEDIGKALPPQTVLLNFMLGEEETVVFILPSGSTHLEANHIVRLPKLKRTVFNQIMEEYQSNALKKGGGLLPILQKLWELIFEPLNSYLESLSATRLILIPDCGMQVLPLHAAWRYVDGSIRYLIDDFIVSYAPSANLYWYSRRRLSTRKNSKKAVVAGISQYPESPDLPMVPIEVRFIGKQMRTRPMLNEAVTRNSLMRAVRKAGLIHLACHGAPFSYKPFEWTGPPPQLELREGGLSISDILAEMDLTHTRLVTLSACHSGIGDIKQRWDDFLGLPGAFLQVGAAGVICSLWTVYDSSTALLMSRFYQNYLEGKQDVAAAFRDAQFWLRSLTGSDLEAFFHSPANRGIQLDIYETYDDRPFENPHYWAPFVYYGS